jgi:hypothetical protein
MFWDSYLEISHRLCVALQYSRMTGRPRFYCGCIDSLDSFVHGGRGVCESEATHRTEEHRSVTAGQVPFRILTVKVCVKSQTQQRDWEFRVNLT